MKLPQELSNKVLSLSLEGKSEEEIINLSELSKDQVHNILSEIDTHEYQNTICYFLAVKYGKDGGDTKEYAEILDSKKILAQHGVTSKDAVCFITSLGEFLQTTEIGPDQFVPVISVYHKLTGSMNIKTYQELRKRKLQILVALPSLWDDEKELQERYRLLTEG
jgi:hypothetical protein